MEQPNEDLSKAMGQLSVTDNSDKTSSSKNLSDMPFDVVGLVIERSDYKEQLILRKTSKSLRALVDKQQPACTRLIVSCKSDWIICHYNDYCVAYVPPFWNQDDIHVGYENQRFDNILKIVDFEQVAFDDLASTLRNLKLQLETFSFDSENFDDSVEFDSFDSQDVNWEFRNKFDDMQEILESIDHKVSVKECRIDVTNLSNAMSILPYLKPGVLEKITFRFDRSVLEWDVDCESMEQVALLDQWKQAKELELRCGFDNEFLTDHATHFKRFLFFEAFIYCETLASIRNYILKHENAKFSTILGYYRNDELRNVVGIKVSPNSSHYSISNSDDYLEFIFTKNRITIEKKKKSN
ncbi:unnamed protein product [Caenorhabditis brenneri]